MELPNYRMPGAKNVGHLLWDKAKDFLQRAFTVIFIATLVIWFLQTFDIHLNVVTDSKDSILAMAASVVAPIFRPMGFGDWRISTALITGFMAKESVVSTLSVLFGSTEALLAASHLWQQQAFWYFACFIPHVWQQLPLSSVSWAENGRQVL